LDKYFISLYYNYYFSPTSFMKKLSHQTARRIAIILAFSMIAPSLFAQSKIKDGTISSSSLPDNSALLELESNNKGLLLSRVSLSNTTTWGLVGSTPVAGMLVYNTNASITSSSTSYPVIQGGVGCYYWNGSGWVAIKMDLPWTVIGNASTNSSTNFLGTTDNHPLVLKVNNTKAGYLDSSGGNGTTIFGVSAISNNLTATYTGVDNTAIGNLAMQNLTTGSWNTAVGKNALQAVTTGGTNTAVGQFALGSNVSGWNNTAVGQTALANNTGSSNTAVGQAALSFNTSGSNNLAFGASALLNNTTGGNNTAIGQDALSSNLTGNSNVAIGPSALRTTTASNNVAIGQNALLATTTGANNTVIGNTAGLLLTTGSNNILIGSGVNATSDAASNTINIGNTVYATGTDAAATRKVGVNENAPNSTLHVGGSLTLPIISTGSLTLTEAHHTVIVNANNTTITLPAATGLTGRIYVIVNESNNNTTVSSTTNIKLYSTNATSPITIASGNSFTFQSDGSIWHRIH
jgi:trimeric autotransporter adhesin